MEPVHVLAGRRGRQRCAPSRFAVVALLIAGALLTPRVASADAIQNTLTKHAPYNYGWSQSNIVVLPTGRGHGYVYDDVTPAAGLLELSSEIYAYSGLLQFNEGDAFAEGEIGATGFDCIKSGWYSLTANLVLNGLVTISVPDPQDWLGGSEAHAKLSVRVRVVDLAIPDFPICNQTFTVVQLDDDHTGDPIMHWFEGQPLAYTSTGIPLTAGKSYRASVYLYLSTRVGCLGLTAGGHAACVFSYQVLNLLDGGQHIINGAALVTGLTIADENPDHTPPTTVFEPVRPLNPCSPNVIGHLVAVDNSGGYGVDEVLWRYAPLGPWTVYGPDDSILENGGDLWLEYHATDRAGNAEQIHSLVHDFLPQVPPLPPLTPRTPGPPLPQPALVRWLEYPGYSQYRVEVADSSGFAEPLVDLTVADPLALLPELPAGETYRWRLSAYLDACNNWSLPVEVGAFTVAGAPARTRVFGDPDARPLEFAIPYPNRDAFALAAGFRHALVIRPGGVITTWGDGLPELFEVPEPNSGFVAVAGGYRFSLGLREDGTLAAWGDNAWGQCDIPDPNAEFAQVACGSRHVLAIKNNGSRVAWGDNSFGQCDPINASHRHLAVSGGWMHSLTLMHPDGWLMAFGRGDDGQTALPDSNTGFVAIAAGGYHNLALRGDGRIVAWGANQRGQCDVPEPNAGFVAIAAGYYLSMALRADGSIEAWGHDDLGEPFVPEPNTGYYALAASASCGYGLQAWDGVTAVDPDPAGDPSLTLGIARVTSNPRGPGTTLWLEVPQARQVTLRVFDLRGRLVRTLWQGDLPAGAHPVAWDGSDDAGRPAARGVYLARMNPASPGRATAKVLLLD